MAGAGRKSEEDPETGIRLKEVREGAFLSQDAFAARISSSRPTVSLYERGRRAPSSVFIRTVCETFRVSAEWLVLGRGSRMHDPQAEPPRATQAVPIVGLAACSLKGWYQREPLSMTATRPGDLFDPDAFAVIAVGQSMVPAGIFEGFICYCSPRTPPGRGDAVCVERRDGFAAIKIFGSVGDDWLELQGWLDESRGKREPYIDRLAQGTIRRVAPIIYVKRKL